MKVKLKFNIELFKRMIRYSFPIMLAGFAFMINENFDKAIQRFVIPENEAGAYGGCYKLAVLMTLFVTAYRMGVEPFFFKQMSRQDAKQIYARVTEYFATISSIVAMGIIVNVGWLKALLIRDESYWIAIDIVPIIVIANLFFGLYYNLSTWYKVIDKTQYGTYISWAGAGATIVFSFALLPWLGFIAFAWATLIAYMLMVGLSYYWGQKNYKIPYRKKKILFYLGLSIFISTGVYLLIPTHYFIGNTILILYIGLIFFIERKTLKAEIQI